MSEVISGYRLSREWFNFCFDNPEKIKPIHTAIYFFAIEHCNRLGWKEKFGFPSQMVMEAIGVKNWRTYSKALNELVYFGYIDMIEVSKNQYSSNIITISATVKKYKAYTKAPTKALDKALQKHSTKQCQSTVSIDKQVTSNNKQINKEREEETPHSRDLENTIIHSLENSEKKIKEDKDFISYQSKILEIPESKILELIPKFFNTIKYDDEKNYRQLGKHKSHFISWVPYEIKRETTQGNTLGQLNGNPIKKTMKL